VRLSQQLWLRLLGWPLSWLILVGHVSPSRSLDVFIKRSMVFLFNVLTWCGERKDTWGPPLSILCSFYKQRVLAMLQRVQAISMSKCVVIVIEGSSKPSILSNVHLLSLSNMLLTTEGGSEYLICLHSPRSPPSLEDFSFARTWVVLSCTFSTPFLGALCFIDDWQMFFNTRRKASHPKDKESSKRKLPSSLPFHSS
jgi:hypothetical protein